MPCGCSEIQIGTTRPYASQKDVVAALNRLATCCVGAIANSTNPLTSPAAALLEGFPDGLETDCGCDVIWLKKPNGTIYFSGDSGASWLEFLQIAAVNTVLASPPAIGSVTPSAASFTTLQVDSLGDMAYFGDSANASSNIVIQGAVGYRQIKFRTGANSRWEMGANNTAESGADAGSDWILSRFNDSGVFQSVVIGITRSTGRVRIGHELEIDGDLNHDGSNIGVYGAAPVAKPTVTGSKGGNAALTSLIDALEQIGWITDNTT